MQPSQACIDLVKSSEGCRLTAYRDGGGTWTIGYGHTSGVREGQAIAQAQADEWLEHDLDEAAEQVQKMVSVPINQGQFDALTSFCFNLGAGRLRDSTLLRLLNEGKYDQAANQFQYWVMDAGRPEEGLIKRRAYERAMFEGAA